MHLNSDRAPNNQTSIPLTPVDRPVTSTTPVITELAEIYGIFDGFFTEIASGADIKLQRSRQTYNVAPDLPEHTPVRDYRSFFSFDIVLEIDQVYEPGEDSRFPQHSKWEGEEGNILNFFQSNSHQEKFQEISKLTGNINSIFTNIKGNKITLAHIYYLLYDLHEIILSIGEETTNGNGINEKTRLLRVLKEIFWGISRTFVVILCWYDDNAKTTPVPIFDLTTLDLTIRSVTFSDSNMISYYLRNAEERFGEKFADTPETREDIAKQYDRLPDKQDKKISQEDFNEAFEYLIYDHVNKFMLKEDGETMSKIAAALYHRKKAGFPALFELKRQCELLSINDDKMARLYKSVCNSIGSIDVLREFAYKAGYHVSGAKEKYLGAEMKSIKATIKIRQTWSALTRKYLTKNFMRPAEQLTISQGISPLRELYILAVQSASTPLLNNQPSVGDFGDRFKKYYANFIIESAYLFSGDGPFIAYIKRGGSIRTRRAASGNSKSALQNATDSLSAISNTISNAVRNVEEMPQRIGRLIEYSGRMLGAHIGKTIVLVSTVAILGPAAPVAFETSMGAVIGGGSLRTLGIAYTAALGISTIKWLNVNHTEAVIEQKIHKENVLEDTTSSNKKPLKII